MCDLRRVVWQEILLEINEIRVTINPIDWALPPKVHDVCEKVAEGCRLSAEQNWWTESSEVGLDTVEQECSLWAKNLSRK